MNLLVLHNQEDLSIFLDCCLLANNFNIKNAIQSSCKSIDDFFKQYQCWSLNFELKNDQLVLCANLKKFYQFIEIDYDSFVTINTNLAQRNNFKNFNNFILEKCHYDENDPESKLSIYQLVYFNCGLKIGDLLLIPNTQNLAVYLGNYKVSTRLVILLIC